MKLDKKIISRYLSYLFGVVFIIMIMFLQAKHDDLSPKFTLGWKAVKRTLLPEKILPYLSFGFSNMLADYYWIKGVQDFLSWDGKDEAYLNYYKNISALDPQFEYPYLFSILALPMNYDTEMLKKLTPNAEKGIVSISDGWKIPFYLGAEYYLFTKENQPAEKYIKIAVERNTAPPVAYITYSSLIAKKIQGAKASQELMKVIYNNTDNDVIKKIASAGIETSILNQMLEKGIAVYYAKYKKYPKEVADLEKENFILLSAELKKAYTVVINNNTGSFSIIEKK